MIDPIGGSLSAPAKAGAPQTTAVGGGFNAALQAAQKAEARRQAQESEMQEIRDKGFSTWVRDMKIEKLKAELKKKVMAQMGLDEEKLAQMMPSVRQILERQIEAEVQRQLAEAQEKAEAGTKDARADDKPAKVAEASEATAGQNLPGKKDQDGKTCPVIPALVWPGGIVNI